MTDPEYVQLPMVCICSTEGKADAAKLREKVRALLSSADSPCTDANFVTRVVGSLYWNWDADASFGCDQWFGVYAKVQRYVPENERSGIDDDTRWQTVLAVSCECDAVEDGLAAIYEWFHENKAVAE